MTVLKKKQCVMLQSEKSKFGIYNVDLQLHEYATQRASSGLYVAQHLYILSNEEIKEGDWYFANNNIFRADDIFNEGNNPNIHKYPKIIATTNPELMDNNVLCNDIQLPQIPQSFIEKYISEYNKENKIKWVDVEYEEIVGDIQLAGRDREIGGLHEINLKLRKDNTIIIHKIKDSYSKEEVQLLCEQSFALGCTTNQKELPTPRTIFRRWIEENL